LGILEVLCKDLWEYLIQGVELSHLLLQTIDWESVRAKLQHAWIGRRHDDLVRAEPEVEVGVLPDFLYHLNHLHGQYLLP
jgi:hypothetical protein